MKKIYFIILIFTSLFACNMVKPPDFKGIDHISLKKNNTGQLVLVAYAQYHNPNLVGGKFKISDVKVFVNDKYLANLNADTYKVPSKKDFTVPLEVNFDSGYLKKSNLLEALNAVLNNKLKIQYKGTIYYVSHGLNIPYSIDYTQDIKVFD